MNANLLAHLIVDCLKSFISSNKGNVVWLYTSKIAKSLGVKSDKRIARYISIVLQTFSDLGLLKFFKYNANNNKIYILEKDSILWKALRSECSTFVKELVLSILDKGRELPEYYAWRIVICVKDKEDKKNSTLYDT